MSYIADSVDGGVLCRCPTHVKEALPVSAGSCVVDRLEVTFDEPGLVASGGVVLSARPVSRLGVEELVRRHFWWMGTARLPTGIGGLRLNDTRALLREHL